MAWLSSAAKSRRETKIEVYNEVLRRLKEADRPEAREPDFDEQLWAHLNRLPASYAMDLNVERAEDVLKHKQLLHLACDPANRPVFDVRLVQVIPVIDKNSGDSVHLLSPRRRSNHPPPASGSSPSLEALAVGTSKPEVQGDNALEAGAKFLRPMHEIIYSTQDRPKLLSQLSSILSELGLTIREAHVFSTVDGYSLAAFVVDGWPFEEVEKLRTALEKKEV